VIEVLARWHTRIDRPCKVIAIFDRFFRSPFGFAVEILVQKTLNASRIDIKIEFIQQHDLRPHGAKNPCDLLSLFVSAAGQIADQFTCLISIQTAIESRDADRLIRLSVLCGNRVDREHRQNGEQYLQ
jgi:hypothetical protein